MQGDTVGGSVVQVKLEVQLLHFKNTTPAAAPAAVMPAAERAQAQPVPKSLPGVLPRELLPPELLSPLKSPFKSPMKSPMKWMKVPESPPWAAALAWLRVVGVFSCYRPCPD